MKLPNWMRVKRTRRVTPGFMTVTLIANTEAFARSMRETAHKLDEIQSAMRYRAQLAKERRRGLDFVRAEGERVRRELGLR